MYTEIRNDTAFTRNVLERLGKSWNHRAAVRKDRPDLDQYYDPTIPDFPITMVPFWNDAEFQALDDGFKRRLLAAAWVAFNERAIYVEEEIVQPACGILFEASLPGVSAPIVKQVIAQIQVDEQFHTLMCLDVCSSARARHRLEEYAVPEPGFGVRMKQILAEARDAKDVAIARVAYASVTEMTISATFDQVAEDLTIQPLNRINTDMHRRDENVHGIAFREMVASVYRKLDPAMQERFCDHVTNVLDSFTSFDASFWASILEHMGVPGRARILSELRRDANKAVASRNYIGIKGLITDLGISDKIRFSF